MRRHRNPDSSAGTPVNAKPVGESRADDKPWRRGPLVREIRDRIAGPRILPAKYSAFPFAAPTKPRKVDPLPEISDLGIDYDTDWAREPTARVARRMMQETLLKATVKGLASPTIQGLDRIAHLEGPVVFAPNHHSHLDIGIILQSIPKRFRDRTLVAAAGDYFFDKKWKAASSALLLNAVPIERKKVSRQSSDQLLALLRDNWNLVIFPEGGRSPDGWGQDFKPGRGLPGHSSRVPGRADSHRRHRRGSSKGAKPSPPPRVHRHLRLRHSSPDPTRTHGPSVLASKPPSPFSPTNSEVTGGRPVAMPPNRKHHRLPDRRQRHGVGSGREPHPNRRPR